MKTLEEQRAADAACFAKWYAKNGITLNANRRARYKYDEQYRERIRKRNREWHAAKRAAKKLAAKAATSTP